MKTIAIVEDNPDNLLLVTALLEDSYAIEAYESGSAALAGLRKSPTDLVLLDISLPEMSGDQLLARMRADHKLKDVPVVALTAHSMSTDRERFLGMGFDAYVSKPILDETALFDVIRELLHEQPATA